MSEELRSSGHVEEQETPKSGLLLSVDPLSAPASLSAKEGDNIDSDTDGTDTSGDAGDSDTTDGGDSDGTDAADADGTDTLIDADGTDAGTDADGSDATKDADGRD
ncbi:MAG TPA: hypothetical protein VF525_11620 [Pyrinomonadaceae bacterium]|jgi:hypothetical protein